MVVDDSPTQARHLELVLAAEGYRVTVAQNGREALDFLASLRPDLIISDILMPEMDGFELCRQIRETDGISSVPIILLSLLNDPADVLRSLNAGANYFISKPCSRELLLSRVRQTLVSGGGSQSEADGDVVHVAVHGEKYAVHAQKARIIDLLLATYETAVEKNLELMEAQKELRLLNQELENRVAERTAALVAETTERLRAMEELRQKDRVLIQQSRQAAMGEMIGNIAHQWRQPINTVGLLIQELAMSYDYDEFDKRHLDETTDKIMQQIRYMSRTIDDFRNFFAPEKEKVPFRIGQVVARTISLVEGSFRDRRIGIDVVADDDPMVEGFPNEFSQALLNILSNAGDVFSERNTPAPRITIRMFTENDRAVVTITDNAGGIREDVLDRVFEPYFTTKDQGKGTGVGLYMVKNIIEKNMAGRVTVRNTAHGAEFRIEV
jgi:C4-dicarboxylate-specific signal transduction histidine kinase/ActR/RegA family two-component response regulator